MTIDKRLIELTHGVRWWIATAAALGWLIVSYTGYGMTPWARMALGIRYLRKFGFPKHSRNYSPSGLAALVESAGFEVERVQLVGDKTKAVYLMGVKQ